MSGFRKPIKNRDDRAIGKRDREIKQVGGDDRQAVAHDRLDDGELGVTRRGAVVVQRGARRDDRAGKADDAADQGHFGRAEPERAAAGEHEGKNIFDDDEPRIETIVEACPHQRGVVIEHAVRDGRHEGERDQPVRQGELDAGEEKQTGGDRHAERDDDEGDIEGRAQRGSFASHPFRIEACRAEAQPVEESSLHCYRYGERQGEAAVFRRPEEFRDQKSDREITDNIDEISGEHPHAGGSWGTPIPAAAAMALKRNGAWIWAGLNMVLHKPCPHKNVLPGIAVWPERSLELPFAMIRECFCRRARGGSRRFNRSRFPLWRGLS